MLVACWLPFYKCGFQSELGPLKSCYFSVRKPTFQLFTSQHTCHKFLLYTVSEKITKKHCNILGQTYNWLHKMSGTNILQQFYLPQVLQRINILTSQAATAATQLHLAHKFELWYYHGEKLNSSTTCLGPLLPPFSLKRKLSRSCISTRRFEITDSRTPMTPPQRNCQR